MRTAAPVILPARIPVIDLREPFLCVNNETQVSNERNIPEFTTTMTALTEHPYESNTDTVYEFDAKPLASLVVIFRLSHTYLFYIKV